MSGRLPGPPFEHRVTINALRGILLERVGPGDWWGRPRVVLVDTLDRARETGPRPTPRHRASEYVRA